MIVSVIANEFLLKILISVENLKFNTLPTAVWYMHVAVQFAFRYFSVVFEMFLYTNCKSHDEWF